MSFGASKPFSFGTPAQQPASTSIFGNTPTPQQPQTTSIFGARQPTQTTLSFTSTGAFGINKPTSTVSPFGQTQPQQQQPTSLLSGSTSGFGLNKPATTSFSFGPASSTTASANPLSTGLGAFGSQQQQQAKPAFSAFGQTTAAPSLSIFGTQTQPQQQQQQQQPATQSFFSSTQSFQQPQQTSFAGLGSFQQQQQQAPATSFLNNNQSALVNQTMNINAATKPNDVDHFMNALINAQVFNDERDAIIAKWNQLQAFYGFGKIFYQNTSLDVSKDNHLTRFKTLGYSCRPVEKNEDGLICLVINQKEELVKTNQKSIVECLHKIFNSDQALSVVINSIKPSADEKTEVIFYVTQRVSPLNDQTNRVPSQTVYAHLNKQEPPVMSLATKPSIKQQLESISVNSFYPLIGLNDDEIKVYLNTPPTGINPLLWEQSKKNNPNSKKLLPVSITGMQEINKRFKQQDQENQNQKRTMAKLNNTIDSLNTQNKLIATKIEQFRTRNEDLEQRVLKLMINYEIRRKIGIPLQDNERYLLSILDSFQMELNSPINKEIQRQKLNDFKEIIKSFENSKRQNTHMMPKLKVSNNVKLGGEVGGGASVGMVNSELIDVNSLNDIQKSLREQQKAFKSMIEIINQDQKDLNKINWDLFNEK